MVGFGELGELGAAGGHLGARFQQRLCRLQRNICSDDGWVVGVLRLLSSCSMQGIDAV